MIVLSLCCSWSHLLSYQRLLELDEQVVTAVRNSSARSLSLVNDELKALEAEIEPPPGTFSHREEPDFWLELPRTFSFTSARFELPLDIASLVVMTPVSYLSSHVTVNSSRRQLYDKVFTRNRSQRDGLLTEEVKTNCLVLELVSIMDLSAGHHGRLV